MNNFSYLENNLAEIRAEISALEKQYDRKITMVCVTKSGSDEELCELVRLGEVNIGENRPGELFRRRQLLSSLGYQPVMHQIGHLQRNKVKLIAGVAELVHSVDSLPLAEKLNKQAHRLDTRISVLIEINSAEEESKGGIPPSMAEDFFLKVRDLDRLDIRGIMTMGPVLDDPEGMRPYFRLTKEIFDTLNTRYGFAGEGVLSMGMSDSYRVAIEEGATLVRIGRRLFRKER